MQNRSAKRRYGIRARLFVSFGILICILLLFLWLTQVVFLDDIYKAIKRRGLARAADTLANTPISATDTRTFTALAEELSAEQDICVLVLSFQSGATNPTVLYEARPPMGALAHNDCVVHAVVDRGSLYPLYLRAREADAQSLTERYVYDARARTFLNLDGGLFESTSEQPSDLVESMLVTRVVSGNTPTAIFLSSVLTPVTATTDTLLSLLWILSISLLLIGAVLSYVIAKRLSDPIVAMTRDARLLADGNADAVFRADGYREAEELAAALTRAATEVRKAALLRRELLANVSHDLRTPVTLIAGYSEMIRDIPGENNPENAQILLDEANRLSALIDDLMDLSKLEAGVGELECSTFPLTETLRDAMTRYDKLHTDAVISFHAETEITIESDRTRVLQILYNLVNNAVNHRGEDGCVEVVQTLPPPDADGRRFVRISVTDHGKGIEHEELARIWDRYYKVDKTRRRSTVGTGLGLSIVRSTTQLLGGRGGVTSTVGVGSTFWFELPL